MLLYQVKKESHNGLLLKNKLRLRNFDANSFEHTKLSQSASSRLFLVRNKSIRFILDSDHGGIFPRELFIIFS